MKTNYTPATGEVRDYYRSGAWLHAKRSPKQFNSKECDDVYFPEFDRWLAELIRKERGEAWLEGWNTGNDYYGECEKGSPKDSWKYDEDQNPYSNGSNET